MSVAAGRATTAPVDELILVGGRWVDRAERLAVRNPARLDEVVGTVPRAGAADVDLAVRAAHRAFQSWSLTPMAERAELLRLGAGSVLDDLEARAVLLVRESGKVIAEARNEIRAGSGVLDYYARLAATFEEVVQLPSPNGRVLVAREPMGVAAVIVPWNAPILLGFLSIAPALLAGNTVVVKPSGDAPLALIDFARALERHLPPGVLNIVTGAGGEVGHAMVTHPLVRRVMFTGSTEVGRTVAADAIASLKRVSLELGGNDPAIVLGDADLDGDLVDELVKGVYPTSGQVCYAIKRIYVQQPLYEELVSRFVEASGRLVVGDGLDPRSDLGPLINPRQLAFVEGLVADARDRGALVRTVGERLEPSASAWANGCFHLPTVVTGVDHSFRVVACEQFGPVIPIMPFDTEEQGIALANDTSFGLASSIWTRDEDRGLALARRVEAGTTFVNLHRPGASGVDMPFGGFKESGLGRGHGVVALEEQFELHTLSSRRPPAPAGTAPPRTP